MFCDKCGAVIPAGTSFCGECGAKLGIVGQWKNASDESEWRSSLKSMDLDAEEREWLAFGIDNKEDEIPVKTGGIKMLIINIVLCIIMVLLLGGIIWQGYSFIQLSSYEGYQATEFENVEDKE